MQRPTQVYRKEPQGAHPRPSPNVASKLFEKYPAERVND
jgi:hypothetical protein